MLEFQPQCCDAAHYLLLGEACYRTGECYNALRPIGDQLWFSLPFRLGLPAGSLMLLHGVLWLLSVGLSALALAEWVHRALPVTHRVRYLALALLAPSAVVHAVFFYPFMQVSLVDAPAGLLALTGIWLLLLSHRFSRWFVFMAAGFSLAAALWLRLAYVYPVLIALSVYGVTWLFRANRQWQELWLLLVLLPVLVQCSATYSRYGEFAFINAEESRFWRDFHLNSPVVGYDTIWPDTGYRWGLPCLLGYGVLEAVKRGEPWSVFCLMHDRAGFYFGSYAARAYLFFGEPNELDDAVAGSVGDPRYWQTDGLEWQADAGQSPYQTRTASALHMQPGHSRYSISTRAYLAAGQHYTWSLWLWSPVTHSAQLAMVPESDSTQAARRGFDVPSVPERRQLWIRPPQADQYRLVLEWDAPESGAGPVYVWGAKLEKGKQATGYQAPANDKRLMRHWSDTLRGFSTLMFVLSLVLVIRLRAAAHRGVAAAVVLVAAVFGEALVVTPEQRFGVVFMTVFWLCPFALLLFWFERNRFRRGVTAS